MLEQGHSAWSPEQALRTVEDALTRSGGTLDAILAINSGMARGAVQAVSAAGRSDVFIAGADADAANVNFVCQGKQTIEVLKDIEPLATTAAETAKLLYDLASRSESGSLHSGGDSLMAGSSIALAGKSVPVAAVRVEVVTPDTVKPLLVDTGFLTADEIPACKSRLAAAAR